MYKDANKRGRKERLFDHWPGGRTFIALRGRSHSSLSALHLLTKSERDPSLDSTETNRCAGMVQRRPPMFIKLIRRVS